MKLEVSSTEFLDEVTKVVREVIAVETELEAKLIPKINRMVKTAIANELDGLMETRPEPHKGRWTEQETKQLKGQLEGFLAHQAVNLNRTKASVAGKIWREKFLQLNL